MSFAVLFTLFQATFRCKGTKKKLYVQAIWQKSVFLYVHYLKNGISSADISARACYYRKSIKLNCAVYYTYSFPSYGEGRRSLTIPVP